MGVQIKRYTSQETYAWNRFLGNAKNSTFLFNREYVDYHQHRFTDHSLMIYVDDNLSALFIANETGDTIESHGGLTYGGLILEKEAKLERVIQYFHHITKYYSSNFKTILYKCVPSYLHTYPANEDLYALFLLKSNLVRRDTSTVLDLTNPSPPQRRTSKAFKLFESGKYSIKTSTDPQEFWKKILEQNLGERFGVAPAHSHQEMKLLMDRFPDNIKLFEVHDHELIAGAVIYSTPTVIHLQYLSSNEMGREGEASGVLMHHLVATFGGDKSWFSLGTSNTEGGRKLNRGMVNWKEGFGARTFVHDFYEIATENHVLLNDYR